MNQEQAEEQAHQVVPEAPRKKKVLKVLPLKNKLVRRNLFQKVLHKQVAAVVEQLQTLSLLLEHQEQQEKYIN